MPNTPRRSRMVTSLCLHQSITSSVSGRDRTINSITLYPFPNPCRPEVLPQPFCSPGPSDPEHPRFALLPLHLSLFSLMSGNLWRGFPLVPPIPPNCSCSYPSSLLIVSIRTPHMLIDSPSDMHGRPYRSSQSIQHPPWISPRDP